MLLGRIAMAEHGIEIFDVDGSSIKFNANDAIYIREWITIHLGRLTDILRRQERQQKELDEIRIKD